MITMSHKQSRGLLYICIALAAFVAIVWTCRGQTFTQVGSSGLPLSASTITNFSPQVMSPPAGNVATADMEAAPAAKFVGQLGVSFPGSKEMSLWSAGATSTGSNGWNRAGWNLLSGVHQIGEPSHMPVNSSPGVTIYQNGNAEYSRRIYALTNSGPRNGSYLYLKNVNPFTDGNGIMMPMYATNGSGTPVVTNGDGAIIREWDQFGLVIAALSGNYVLGETNMAGSYDIITGVGNSIPLYICCNAQLGTEPVLGQKAWVAFDNRYLANSSLPAATHFQMWRPNVYAFTNANNVDSFMIEQSPEHGRIEVETNAYFIHTKQFWVTNRGEMMALATGPYLDITKGACLNTGTNVIFSWASAHDNSKGCTWSFDGESAYRFGVVQKNGQFPKLVHAAGTPFGIAISDNSDLQTDQSAQTLTDEFAVDTSLNLSLGTTKTGTDAAGGATTINGGVSTGTGRGGAVIVQTTPSATGSSSAANSLSVRSYISPKDVTLTETTATTVCNVAIPSSSTVGIRVFATTRANDATDFQVRSDSFLVTAENKAGTVIAGISTIGTGDSAVAVSTGTLTTTWTAVANGASVDIKCNSTSSLTQTTLATRWRIETDSPAVITVTAQ